MAAFVTAFKMNSYVQRRGTDGFLMSLLPGLNR